MAQLTGQKVKDTYSQLLKLSTSGVTTTRKAVESGIGETTGLLLASNSVGLVNPYISSVPTSTTVTAALFSDGAGQIVTRQLGSNAFDSGYPAQDYDTGWMDIPQYDPVKATGIVPISGIPAHRVPQYRLINRTLHFRGNIYIPLSPTDGNPNIPAVADITSIETTQSTTVSVEDNGVSVGAGVITLPSIKLNDLVVPERDTYLSIFHPLFRNAETHNSSGDQFKYMYNTFAAIKLDTQGRIIIESLSAFEAAGLSPIGVIKMNPIHEIMTTWVTGTNHRISTYENYETYNINAADQRDVTNTGFLLPFNFSGDGTDMSTWGGLCIVLDGLSFTVSNLLPLESLH